MQLIVDSVCCVIMSVLSANFVILSALINQTFFINQSPGVSNVYMYLNYIYNDGYHQNLDYWMELEKSNLYGVPVFQGNLSNVSLIRKTDKYCGPDVLVYMLRLVYYHDMENYGDTPDVNKIILPGPNNYRCKTTIYNLNVDEEHNNTTMMVRVTQSPVTIIDTTEKKITISQDDHDNYNEDTFGYNKTIKSSNCNEIFNCTITNVLLFSISFNSVFAGILYIMFKMFLYFYNKYRK